MALKKKIHVTDLGVLQGPQVHDGPRPTDEPSKQTPDSFAKRHLNDNALRRKLPKRKGGPAISVLTAWMGTVGNIPMSMEG